MEKMKRDSAEKIRIYQSLFMGLRNVYGTYDAKTGKVRQVKEPVTNEVIRAHLTGKRSYGVYLLVGKKTGALAVDFDQDELSAPIAYVAGARRYDMSAYIERSKSKGYHVWIFFEKGGVLAQKARLVANKILADIGKSGTEIFPKQDALADGISYGNFINAPLFGALVPKGRTVFVDPAKPTKVYPDQWELLQRIQRVPEYRLDAVIKSCNLHEQAPPVERGKYNRHTDTDDDTSPFGLPPCGRRMLAEGVDSYQRVSCFRLAVHLKRNGLPYDLALITLKAWAKKNHPADGKRLITDGEVEYQTKCAFENSYRSFGCEDPAMVPFCDKNCPLYAYTVGKHSA
ncbi:MAG: hypothetical protein GY845_29995 [Planctomycetes bacterium]|nr:hypothetical protein [Planctomycetota bacterium]